MINKEFFELGIPFCIHWERFADHKASFVMLSECSPNHGICFIMVLETLLNHSELYSMVRERFPNHEKTDLEFKKSLLTRS